jgi:hypothetical protein
MRQQTFQQPGCDHFIPPTASNPVRHIPPSQKEGFVHPFEARNNQGPLLRHLPHNYDNSSTSRGLVFVSPILGHLHVSQLRKPF